MSLVDVLLGLYWDWMGLVGIGLGFVVFGGVGVGFGEVFSPLENGGIPSIPNEDGSQFRERPPPLLGDRTHPQSMTLGWRTAQGDPTVPPTPHLPPHRSHIACAS